MDICTTLSFQISYDGAAYLDLFHVAQTAAGPWTSYEATISPVVANSMLLLPAGAGLNVPFLKIRSGTRLRPISQGADRCSRSCSVISFMWPGDPQHYSVDPMLAAMIAASHDKAHSTDRNGRLVPFPKSGPNRGPRPTMTLSEKRSEKWSWLKAWAMQIARRRGMKKAIVALARRLAVIMHRIWVDGTEFRWTREVVAA